MDEIRKDWIKPECYVYQLGMVEYGQAWRLQKRLAGEVAAGERPAALLLLEHPHTFTFGRRGKPENLLWSEKQLAEKGIQVHWVDRGGDVTYHGPGQLVGYPIFPLNPKLNTTNEGSSGGKTQKVDVLGYIRKLEAALISALADLGVASGQLDGLSGVWVQPHVPSRCLYCPPDMRQKPAKIAAIGLKVDANGISSHGFSLNVAPDMSYWEGIIGCGLPDHPLTCLADILEPTPNMEDVLEAVIQSFERAFNYQMTSIASSEIISLTEDGFDRQ
jgi:lipoyl(octanoyl) transferase